MALKPPADPCMCGSFEDWHGECYAGLSQQEIDARHKKLMAEWRKEARRQIVAQAVAYVKSLSAAVDRTSKTK